GGYFPHRWCATPRRYPMHRGLIFPGSGKAKERDARTETWHTSSGPPLARSRPGATILPWLYRSRSGNEAPLRLFAMMRTGVGSLTIAWLNPSLLGLFLDGQASA